MRRFAVLAAVLAMFMSLAIPAFAGGPPPRGNDGERVRVVVFVESQGLYYDSIVGPSLPANGPFQELRHNGPDDALSTEFGPGDPGYLGGRWWVDANNNGEMDDGDMYFSCPLLGKGSATPPAG